MSAQEHRQLKTLASFHGITMKDFLLSKVLPVNGSLSRSEKRTETAYLLQSAANRKRLIQAVSRSRNKNKSFRSLRELKHALGI